jgi:ABC-type nitrate/sulfonate/bicarbonate transport system substrate-binding protein
MVIDAFSRRTLLGGTVGAAVSAGLMPRPAWAQSVPLNVSYHPAYSRVHAMHIAKLPEAEGLKPEWIKFTSGPPTVYAFQAGSVDLGVLGIPPIMGGLAAGQRLKVIAIDSDYTQGEGLMARPGAGIEKLADVKGKKIGTIKGTSAHFSFFSALKKAKLAPDDVKTIFLDGTTLVPAFTAGDIDAAWIFQPFWYILADKGGRAIVTDRELGIPAIGLWIGREEWLQKNRATAEKFLVALEKSVEARRTHRDAVIQRLVSTIGLTPQIAERLYTGDVAVSLAEQVKDAYPLSITTGPRKGLGAFLTSMAEFLAEQKIIPTQPDAGAAVDGSFAVEALKSMKG